MSHCFMCIHKKECKEDLHNCSFYEAMSCGTCKHEYKAIMAEPCNICYVYDKWEACHE